MAIFRFYNGTDNIDLARKIIATTDRCRCFDGNNNIALHLVDVDDILATNLRIYDGATIKAFSKDGCGIRTLRKMEEYWYDLITDFSVVSTPSDVVYSGTANWQPNTAIAANTRLNVDGEAVQCNKDPNVAIDIYFTSIFGNQITVQNKTWAHKTSSSYQVVSATTDVFERVSESVISINSIEKTISVGSYYQIASSWWNPGDHGAGSYLYEVYNNSDGSFDVRIYIYEYDEQGDSAYVKVDCYVE